MEGKSGLLLLKTGSQSWSWSSEGMHLAFSSDGHSVSQRLAASSRERGTRLESWRLL